MRCRRGLRQEHEGSQAALGNRWRALLLIVAYKCVAAPLFTLGWLLLSGLPEGLARSVLLQSAMPTVMVSAVSAAYYQTDAELAAFYKSPLGQKLLASEPRAIQFSMSYMNQWAQNFAETVNGEFRAEMRKRGKQI